MLRFAVAQGSENEDIDWGLCLSPPSWPPSARVYWPPFTAAIEEKMSGAPLPQASRVTARVVK